MEFSVIHLCGCYAMSLDVWLLTLSDVTIHLIRLESFTISLKISKLADVQICQNISQEAC
jgi:hypothetical protein